MDIYNPRAIPRNVREIPEEFQKMCMKLCQDEPMPRFASPEDLISFILMDLDSREKRVVKDYINALLALNASDADLASVWRRAGADLILSGEKEGMMADFFRLIASSVEPS
jgi:hypothetical protein